VRRLVLLVGLALPRSVWGQDTTVVLPDTIQAVRLEAAARITVDGRLSEAAWRRAPPIGGFRQREPDEGAPATEATDVRVVYDRGTLYIGVLARDRSPDAVIARILARDKVMQTEFDGKPRFAGDDAVAILLDPFHDHRNAFIFATNANGAEFDALLSDEGRGFNIDWRAIWQVAATRTTDGWSAEFAIPFRSLRYPTDPGTWGFNVYRLIRGKNEEVLWRSYSRSNEGFARVSRAGHLVGLRDLPAPGLNAELKPYAVGGGDDLARDPGPGRERRGTGDLGVDVKSEVRPGIVLDLTYNTDFAQVEVDDQQVNLTRFSLFFPEKREFFLENAGIFDFGARGTFEPPPFQLFFSRRIGIGDDGSVPLLGGGRLTGRAGAQTLGLLSVVTGERGDTPQTAFNVFRVKRDVGSANYLGAMVVDRRGGGTANTAGGVDWSFWPRPALNVQGFAARTATTGVGGNGGAVRIAGDYQTNRLGISGQHLVVGPEANADAGFITRTDIRRTQANLRVTFRPDRFHLRRLNIVSFNDHVVDMDWRRQDVQFSIGLRPVFSSEDGLGLFYNHGRYRVTEDFELADTVEVLVGDYLQSGLSLFFQTSPARPVFLNGDLEDNRSFGGSVRSANVTLNASAGVHLALGVGYRASRAQLPNGDLDVDLWSLRATYAFNTRLTFNSLLQYNSLTRDVSMNARLNYIYRPGSDIFIVLNEQRGSATSAWDIRDRGARIKVTYLARL
jgi:hypothetical protein